MGGAFDIYHIHSLAHLARAGDEAHQPHSKYPPPADLLVRLVPVPARLRRGPRVKRATDAWTAPSAVRRVSPPLLGDQAARDRRLRCWLAPRLPPPLPPGVCPASTQLSSPGSDFRAPSTKFRTLSSEFRAPGADGHRTPLIIAFTPTPTHYALRIHVLLVVPLAARWHPVLRVPSLPVAPRNSCLQCSFGLRWLDYPADRGAAAASPCRCRLVDAALIWQPVVHHQVTRR